MKALEALHTNDALIASIVYKWTHTVYWITVSLLFLLLLLLKATNYL